MNILVNDGLDAKAISLLTNNGYQVNVLKVAQEQLINYIQKHAITILIVKNATKVNRTLLESCSSLKVVGKIGYTFENIDVSACNDHGIIAFNTPYAAVNAVAELTIAHLLSGARHLYDANRNMPLEGDSQFVPLKNSYSRGVELQNKRLGIIGFGKIGRAVAQKALALGMEVCVASTTRGEVDIPISFFNKQSITLSASLVSFDEVITTSDFISIHVSPQKEYLLTQIEFEKMKSGVGIINTSSGAVIHEVDMVKYLENNKISFCGLDVFQDEPTPAVQVLMQPNVSLSPHIGGLTAESLGRCEIELVESILKHFN